MQTLRAVLRFGAAVGLSTVAWGWTLSAARSPGTSGAMRPIFLQTPGGSRLTPFSLQSDFQPSWNPLHQAVAQTPMSADWTARGLELAEVTRCLIAIAVTTQARSAMQRLYLQDGQRRRVPKQAS
jgi:hypothetical protein